MGFVVISSVLGCRMSDPFNFFLSSRSFFRVIFCLFRRRRRRLLLRSSSSFSSSFLRRFLRRRRRLLLLRSSSSSFSCRFLHRRRRFLHIVFLQSSSSSSISEFFSRRRHLLHIVFLQSSPPEVGPDGPVRASITFLDRRLRRTSARGTPNSSGSPFSSGLFLFSSRDSGIVNFNL